MRSFSLSLLGSLSALSALSACTPAAATPLSATPAVAPTVSRPDGPPKGPDPFEASGPYRLEDLPEKEASFEAARSIYVRARAREAELRKIIPGPSAACRRYARRTPIKPGEACPDRATSLSALSAAMLENDPQQQDARLAGVEACGDLPVGFVRALRADLAPPECADALVEAFLPLARGKEEAEPGGPVGHALVGLWLAGVLSRAVGPMPRMKRPFNRATVLRYTGGPFKDWFVKQARALDGLAVLASNLEGYGRAVAAVEAGLADMRFVDRVREVPIPDEWIEESEVRQAYESQLDQALEPRKLRGRDAALVGLRELALYGAVKDARVGRARALLSRLFGGARIDALDGLLLPEVQPAPPRSPEEILASRLPTFYGGELFPEPRADEAWVLTSTTQGLLPGVRQAFAKPDGASPPAFERYLRARVDLGRTFFRGADFDRVVQLAELAPERFKTPESRFYLALSLALRKGPEGAFAMMKAPSPAALELRGTEALDALVSEAGPYAGQAAFAAAWLRQLSPPEEAGASWFLDVTARFRKAESLLTASDDKAKARERGQVAYETARVSK